jgi:hypothetical protein
MDGTTSLPREKLPTPNHAAPLRIGGLSCRSTPTMGFDVLLRPTIAATC